MYHGIALCELIEPLGRNVNVSAATHIGAVELVLRVSAALFELSNVTLTLPLT